jgi:hypothetical protein
MSHLLATSVEPGLNHLAKDLLVASRPGRACFAINNHNRPSPVCAGHGRFWECFVQVSDLAGSDVVVELEHASDLRKRDAISLRGRVGAADGWIRGAWRFQAVSLRYEFEQFDVTHGQITSHMRNYLS